jgi:hypothetical protein
MAQKIIERVQARYEARELPFGKLYEWHPNYVENIDLRRGDSCLPLFTECRGRVSFSEFSTS